MADPTVPPPPPAPEGLPDRTPEAEDAFVAAWDAQASLRPLADVITDAMAARRPKLAARLVDLLSDEQLAELDDPALRRARAAARLLLVDRPPAPAQVADLEDAWREAREAWMRRVRSRMRRRATSRHTTIFGVAPTARGRGRGPRRS